MIDGTKGPSRTGYETVSDAVYARTAERFAQFGKMELTALVPAMLSELARLSQMELTPLQRFALLEPLKPLIRDTTARLPKSSSADSEPGGGGTTLTVEQRLYMVMAENLGRLLRDLDRPRYLAIEGRAAKRRWAQIYLMKTFGRQIFYAASTQRTAPAGTWQGLHDLFHYLVMRGEASLQPPGGAPSAQPGFQFEPAYKGLLLLGCYDAIRRAAQDEGAPDALPPVDRALFRLFSAWASDTWLVEPDAPLERADLVVIQRRKDEARLAMEMILVETTKDAPPRLESTVVHELFRGWVLVPAQPFVDLVAPRHALLRDIGPRASG